MEAATACVVDIACIPSAPNIFLGNWTHPKPLPTVIEVRAAKLDTSVVVLDEGTDYDILCFPDRRLVVKFGRRVSISEGQTLWMLARYCPQVPVPKVYGWCQDGGECFVYMEYLEGRTLRACLDTFSDKELRDVAAQLRPMVRCIRRLRQPRGHTFIGSPTRGPITDQVWDACQDPNGAGPFATVRAFNDSLTALANCLPGYPDDDFFQSFRAALPDTAGICFTHTDLHDANIIVSPTTSKVIGIIDWQESGWYPGYWEYVKASCMADPARCWHSYVDMAFDERYEGAAHALESYYETGLLS
ncbi:kinase-like domain-containing protein [Mycena polygramma]|nr:kinase-like domain-containing protein [Mycena polygramma]